MRTGGGAEGCSARLARPELVSSHLSAPLSIRATARPQELDDASGRLPRVVAALGRLLDATFDWRGADARAQASNARDYARWVWNATFTRGGCSALLATVYDGFDAADAARVAEWSGLPCS